MMKLWMHLIPFAAFTSAYANQVDCDFEKGSCSWSIEGFGRISDNQFNSTDGWNDNMHRNEVNYAVMEFNPTKERSALTSGFEINPGEKCLSFKYQMKGFKRSCISIEVYSSDGISLSHIWSSQIQPQLHGWNEINETINVKTKSNIVIRFLHDNCFNVTFYISSISLKTQSCTESTTTFRKSPSIVNPTDTATYTTPTTVNTSSYYTKDGVIIDIVIGGFAFTVALLLIATYLYRRRATSPNANMPKHSAVSGLTYSGATRPKNDNGETSHSIETLNQISETAHYNAQAECSTVLKTQPRQSKTQQRFITGALNIYPSQFQLLNDENNVTNLEQIQNQYHQSADKGGINSYETVHNTDNLRTEFRAETYDCTTIHPTTIPDPTYDHSNFKQNVDNIYDHSNSGTLSKDMGYLDHLCDANLQLSMQDVDPTYDHI